VEQYKYTISISPSAGIVSENPNTLILKLGKQKPDNKAVITYEQCVNIGKNQTLQIWSRLICIFIYTNAARLEG